MKLTDAKRDLWQRHRPLMRGLGFFAGGAIAGWLLPKIIGPFAFIGAALAVMVYLGVQSLRLEKRMQASLRELQQNLVELERLSPRPPLLRDIFLNDPPELYEIAKRINHEHGFPWTDPRTGITYDPPKRH